MATTANLDRTLAMYRKYQNVKPPEKRRWYQRTALLAGLLALLACSVSATGIALFYPDLLGTSASAQGLSEADLQATVDLIVAANISLATDMPPGALETAIYAAVLQTIEASGSPPEGESPTANPSLSPTPTLPGSIIFPTAPPTVTRTLAPGESPPPPVPTPTPSRTPTATLPGPTATSGSTATATLAPTGTASLAPTTTSVPPTNTPVPPTSTPERVLASHSASNAGRRQTAARIDGGGRRLTSRSIRPAGSGTLQADAIPSEALHRQRRRRSHGPSEDRC